MELIAFLLRVFNAETQRRRVRRVLFSRVEHVERVEMFMLAARPHSSIIYSGSSTEGSDPFCLDKQKTAANPPQLRARPQVEFK